MAILRRTAARAELPIVNPRCGVSPCGLVPGAWCLRARADGSFGDSVLPMLTRSTIPLWCACHALGSPAARSQGDRAYSETVLEMVRERLAREPRSADLRTSCGSRLSRGHARGSASLHRQTLAQSEPFEVKEARRRQE